jgi:hypothetical protein
MHIGMSAAKAALNMLCKCYCFKHQLDPAHAPQTSTYILDAHAGLSVLIAALSEKTRQKVMAFFDRKMSSSYRNGRKAGLAAAKRDGASVVSTERA